MRFDKLPPGMSNLPDGVPAQARGRRPDGHGSDALGRALGGSVSWDSVGRAPLGRRTTVAAWVLLLLDIIAAWTALTADSADFPGSLLTWGGNGPVVATVAIAAAITLSVAAIPSHGLRAATGPWLKMIAAGLVGSVIACAALTVVAVLGAVAVVLGLLLVGVLIAALAG